MWHLSCADQHTIAPPLLLAFPLFPCTSLLLRAARLSPFDSQVFTWLGEHFRVVAKNPARAQQCYHKAFLCNPGNAHAGVRVANALLAEGKLPEAADACRSAVTAQPKARWAWWRLGEILLRGPSSGLSEAVEALQSALRLTPKEAPVWEALARAYLKQGKYTAALKVWLDCSGGLPGAFLFFCR